MIGSTDAPSGPSTDGDSKQGAANHGKHPQAHEGGTTTMDGAGVKFVHHDHENLHEYVSKARQVSVFSIGFTMICACVGFAFAWKASSSTLMAYALEALVNMCSSVLVLWRFWDDPDGEGQYFEITRRRERRASVGVGFTFVVIGFATAVQAIVHLARHERPSESQVLIAISSISIVILSWSCIVKVYLSSVLMSTALRKDAITTGACLMMAGGILFSTAVHKAHPQVWWLDSVVALVVSALLPILGIRALTRNKWWQKSFWTDEDLPTVEKIGPQAGMTPSKAAELSSYAHFLHDMPSSAAVDLPRQ